MRLRNCLRAVGLVIPGLATATGCAPTYSIPMTGQALAGYDSGKALVTYLQQTNATPAVCDLRATPPFVTHFDESVSTLLVQGLVQGRIDPVIWRRCTDAVLDGAGGE